MTCVVPFRQNGRLTREQKSFNNFHAKARQVIERSFALLFGRWRRLKNLKMQRIDMMAFVVLAACVLHNVCLEFDDDEVESYIQDGREATDDNGDDSTPASAYGQEENSSDAEAFRQELCDELYTRRQSRSAVVRERHNNN
jgi:DDE superfamily endonuclease